MSSLYVASGYWYVNYAVGDGGAETGDFTFSGQDVGFLYGRVVNSDAGTFTVNGQDAGFLYNRRLSVDAGTFTFTGQDATLEYGRALASDSGTFTLVGQNNGFTVTRRLLAEAGTFALTGNNAGLFYGRALAANVQAFAFVGQVANLVYTPQVWAHQLLPGITAGQMLTEIWQAVNATGGIPSTAQIAAAIRTDLETGEPIPVNVVQVNGYDVDGSGTEADPWGPV